MAQKNIQPLKGFRDFLPEEAMVREKILETIRTVFQRYGFLPVETPALEYREILTGKYGQEADKLMYEFKDQGGRAVAMRYDLTVPLARVMAQYENDLVLPFKRYQIAPVWRADRPQKGRFREFTQCDVDVVGSASLFADAEVIACLNEALRQLGLEDILIRLNNRKVLDGLLRAAGIPEKNTLAAVRALDKLSKIGEPGVRAELNAAGAKSQSCDRLFEFLNTGVEDPGDIEKKFADIAGAGELAELVEILLQMQVKNYQVDLSLARGLDYYTGTIFEFVLPDAQAFGSVAGGGRYDNLIGQLGGKVVPAVGGSIGIDRLTDALEELDLASAAATTAVLVCNLAENLVDKYLAVTRELRAAGVNADFYYETAKLEKQLKYADRKNFKYAILLGATEAQAGTVTLKNLVTGSQEIVNQSQLVSRLKM